ncbi:hypothetical protein M413DRAFT_408453 [Hebeloma cylindrosporum]|uniref:Uncharacterized protein n=1 Tax=Hebeloma cylindrosporum TaxID=76867 RepID=A0A0C3CG43_HEBCY|nr:hypothetical protein M413DRAFT_408453 [Hebeloma cylindrosporum h7]
MLYSDATHVAQFGQAKLWPIYGYIGNGSKYERGRPSANAGYNVAFLPSLPDAITDFILNDPAGKVSAPLLAHCRRELFHGCWRIILDDEFLEAYEHGIVIDCGDGIRRRVYPRIFFYSADYPKKVLIATIRDKGQCPCPRCKVTKEEVSNVGKPSDMNIRKSRARKDDEDHQNRVRAARSLIYQKGYVVNSTYVDDLLKADSLVPTEASFMNAFSERLHKFGLDFFDLIVVDLMHELELGIWKALILHLIRILHSQGQNVVHEFNARFRLVAAFGRSTIRKFPYNVADLSKLAARDYEDILQCCIPCLEGLLPSPHNETILDLLYVLNYWHSLAKLRMHTDTTLRIFRQTTTLLGDALRYFANETCKHFKTFETDKEYQARNRATARQVAKQSAPAASSAGVPPAQSQADLPSAPVSVQAAGLRSEAPVAVQAALLSPSAPIAPQFGSSGKRPKFFNIGTPKTHFFPDYAEQIENLGTTDNLSSKLGESQHTRTKGFNNRTNFNNATPQIIGMDVREAVHDRMTYDLEDLKSSESQTTAPENSVIEPTELDKGYHMARDEKNKVYLPDLLEQNETDPAYHKFLPRLKTYLLSKKKGTAIPGEDPKFSDAEISQVIIKDNFIFSHATAAFNYTTYDI